MATYSSIRYNFPVVNSSTSSQIGAGAMKLIKTLTASSSSTLSFVDGSSDVVLDNTYKTYLFKLIEIHPQTDDKRINLAFSIDGGSKYNVATTTSFFIAQHNEGDSATSLSYNTTRDLAQSTNQQPLADIGNANDEALSGTLYLFAPSSTTFVKHFIATIQSTDGYDYVLSYRNAGYANVTAAIDGIEFTCSSGNIDSGIIKMYGLSKS